MKDGSCQVGGHSLLSKGASVGRNTSSSSFHLPPEADEDEVSNGLSVVHRSEHGGTRKLLNASFQTHLRKTTQLNRGSRLSFHRRLADEMDDAGNRRDTERDRDMDKNIDRNRDRNRDRRGTRHWSGERRRTTS